MRICLVNPSLINPDMAVTCWPPLGLAYVAAQALKAGHEVVIVDRSRLMVQGLGIEAADNALIKALDAKPDIVGITATTPLIPDAYRVAKLTKKILPSCRVILGGSHATALPEQTKQECPEIDEIIIGAGENYFLDKPVCNIDEFGFPARHLLDMDYYLQKSKWLIRGISVRGTPIFTTRGCPYHCTFCTGNLVFGNRILFHSVGHVIAEIELLIEKYKIEGLYFADDMFSANKKRAIDICNEMIRRGINKKIIFAVQMTAKAAQDEVLLLKLKEAGCVQVEIGTESGSQRMLDIMKKYSTVEDNYKMAKVVKRVGLRFIANIIVGMPTETREDFMASIRFIKKTDPDMVALCKLILLPGSELYKRYQTTHTEWEKFLQSDTVENLTAMPNEEFFVLLRKWQKWVTIHNFKKYLVYNLKRDFIGTFKELVKLTRRKLCENMPD